MPLPENAAGGSRQVLANIGFSLINGKKGENLMICVWSNLIMIGAPDIIREHLAGFWISFRNPRPQRARDISGLIFKNLTAAITIMRLPLVLLLTHSRQICFSAYAFRG